MGLVIVPSIDLRGGHVVRLAQGDYARQTNYALDPLAAAAGFLAAGAQWLHIVDLDGAKAGRPMQTELVASLAAKSGLKVQVGGGVRSTDDIDRLLQAGANRVVVGTQAMENWPWFEKLAHSIQYRDRLVLALDAKDGTVATRGWTASAGRLAADVARQVSGWKLAAILYTDVAKDGMLGGPNLEQTRLIAEAGDTPVIASGGVGDIRHIRELTRLPIWGVIVGRSLYEGKVDLAEAIRAAQDANNAL
jgi:phosphoribosylformimino-5-aminoimidazole carboxamide ribotide isomerase